jgi:hypothetical protein
MHKYILLVVCLLGPFAFADQNPNVSAPSNGTTVQSPVHFSATAGSTSCPQGIASMGIYLTVGNKTFVENGSSLDTDLDVADGTYTSTIEQWDNCGGASTTHVSYTVSGSGGGGGKTLSSLQASGGWAGWGELPPNYSICTSCGSGVTWSMKRGIKSPSMSGNSAEYTIGGKTAYSDVLWNNHLIGPDSSQGMPDPQQTIVPPLHDFTYEIYFYGDNLSLSENLEFDLGQFFDNYGYLFGVQCQIVNGQVWGLWNPSKNHWEPTNIPCKPVSNTWNHLTVKFERTSSNELLYQTVTLNEATSNINITYPRYYTPGWYGLVVNFQLDGNYKQQSYSVYVDDLSITYE